MSLEKWSEDDWVYLNQLTERGFRVIREQRSEGCENPDMYSELQVTLFLIAVAVVADTECDSVDLVAPERALKLARLGSSAELAGYVENLGLAPADFISFAPGDLRRRIEKSPFLREMSSKLVA